MANSIQNKTKQTLEIPKDLMEHHKTSHHFQNF